MDLGNIFSNFSRLFPIFSKYAKKHKKNHQFPARPMAVNSFCHIFSSVPPPQKFLNLPLIQYPLCILSHGSIEQMPVVVVLVCILFFQLLVVLMKWSLIHTPYATLKCAEVDHANAVQMSYWPRSCIA